MRRCWSCTLWVEILFDGEILPVYHYFFIKYLKIIHAKAKLLQEDFFFHHTFICQRRFSNEKVGNRNI